MRDIDYNLLPVFQALFEERRVTKAAVRLNLTQSAISHALSRLRSSLNDDLFVRSPGGLVPTARALALAPIVNEVLQRLRGALTLDDFDPVASNRRFRLAIGGYLSELLTPQLIARALSQRASCRFDILNRGIDAADLLDSGVIDIAVGTGTDLPARFASAAILHERAVWIARKDHPVAAQTRNIKDLQALPRLELTAGVADAERWQFWLSAEDMHPAELSQGASRPVVEHHHTRSAIAIVCQTDLVALVPERIVRQMQNDFPVRILPQLGPPILTEIRVAWAKANENDAGHRWLRNLLLEVAREHGAPQSG